LFSALAPFIASLVSMVGFFKINILKNERVVSTPVAASCPNVIRIRVCIAVDGVSVITTDTTGMGFVYQGVVTLE
jgi:hypothetical protein